MIETSTKRANTQIITGAEYHGLPVHRNQSYYKDYLDRIIGVIDDALNTHRTVAVVRFDLHIPLTNSRGEQVQDHRALVSRFLGSFKAKLSSLVIQRERRGGRAYSPKHFHVWASEQNISEQPHYHVALLINSQHFYSLGPYTDKARILYEKKQSKYLAQLIIEAWTSALEESVEKSRELIHFIPRITYVHRDNRDDFAAAFQLLAYLAKVDTKHFGIGRRSFGASQRIERRVI